jgi:hypothetical protein
MAIAGFKQIFGNQLQTRERGGKSGRSMFITAGNGYDMLRSYDESQPPVINTLH